MKSYYYNKKVSATSTQQTFELPRLRGFFVQNNGDYNVQINFENDITDDSIILLVGQSLPLKGDMLDIRYKALPVDGDPTDPTATLFIGGMLHEKAE